MTFPGMWAELAEIGRDPSTGGYRRSAFGPAERACRAWFVAQAAARGLIVETDGNGNDVVWWRPAGVARAGGVVTGSHLDSVPDGGAYDGPLGIVSALAAVDLLRERGIQPVRPIGIAAFAEEEGATFGLACLGSRLLTGAVEPGRAAALGDGSGTGLPAAMAGAGHTADLGPSDLLASPSAYVELHVEQGRALADLDAPVGLATAIWPHGRWRLEFAGEGNHAGTTRLEDRRDPMLTFAETVLAARKKARLAGALATVGRVEVEPNGTNAIPSLVRAWLDARAPDEATLTDLVKGLGAHATARADRDGTTLSVTAESVTAAVDFAGPLTDRLHTLLPEAPLLPTGAGHDAGILATGGPAHPPIPTAMLFVRNPTGVSHAPQERAEDADCLAGVAALATVLEELACRWPG